MPGWLRDFDGSSTARTLASNTISPHLSPRRVATVASIIVASIACSTRGTSSTRPAITRPLSSSTITVWLRSAR